MFTFDDNGDQLWLAGNIAIDADDEVVTIPVFKLMDLRGALTMTPAT